MSTTILPALLSPPAALLPPPAAICSVTVVVRQRGSTGERLGGFVFLGLALGVLVALLVRWLFGLYLRAQQAAAVAPAPVAEAAAHVTLRAAFLGFLLVASGADASPRTPEDFGRHHKLHSLQRFLADPTYFAFHGAEATPDGYYGFIATLDVYGFPELKQGQATAGSVWVVDEGNGAQANAKAIIIGWNVLPALYGDSRTHFFTSWTDVGFTKTGCLNTKCAGFQPEKGAAIAPGDVIQNVSAPKGGGSKQNLTLKIVKQGGASGDWVVHAGLNREPAPIGRFPRSLFTGGFAEKAAAVRFGGMVTAPAADNPPAPMGSGYLPGASAASVTGVQLVGTDGRASPVTSDLPKLESRPEAYAVSPVENGSFFYGGPAKAPTARGVIN